MAILFSNLLHRRERPSGPAVGGMLLPNIRWRMWGCQYVPMCLFVCLSACLSVCLFVCLFTLILFVCLFIWFYLFVSVCGPTKLWKLWHLVMFFSWLHGFLACAVVSVGNFEDFCDNAGYSLLLWHQFCVYQVFIRIARHFHYTHGPDVIPDVIMWFDFFIAISAIFSRIHQESNRSRAATKMIKMH